MKYWLYIGKQFDKQWCKGISSANSLEELKNQQLQNNIIVIFARSINISMIYSKHHRRNQLFRFLQQLLFFQSIHLKLSDSIIYLAQTTHPGIPKFILEDIKNNLMNGIELIAILEKYVDFFEPLAVNLIKLGLKTGQLEKSLRIWLTHQTQLNDFYNRLKQQLFYPSLIFVIACAFLGFFIFSLLPRYQQLFQQLQLSCPNTVIWLQHVDAFHVSVLIVLFISLGFFYKKIPGIKQLVSTIHWYQWSELMHMTQDSGYNLSDGMMLIEDDIASDIKTWHSNSLLLLRSGIPFADILEQSKDIPHHLKDFLVLVHYQSNTAQFFFQVNFLLKKQLDDYLIWIEKYLQPLMLLLLSLFCATLFYLLYSPLLELGKII